MEVEAEWARPSFLDNETVFKGKTRPMSKEQSKLFVACVISEASKSKIDVAEAEWPFLSQIIKRRIEVMKLPITFTDQALMAVNALTEVAGGAVVILIDALTRYEGKTITMDELTKLYPNGFYDEDTFTDYIDNHLKPHKVKWSEIYGPKRS